MKHEHRRRLVTVAHGTRDRSGNRIAATLTARAGDQLGMPATAAYVELCRPLLTDELRAGRGPTVVVPLLLSTGHHVRVDLPAAVQSAPSGAGGIVLGGPLGPNPRLALAQADRLQAAGARPGQPVVMVAAGSTDPAATGCLDRAAEHLAERWGAPVRVATMTGRGRRVADVVRPGDAVSTYLLAPGHFARRARESSLAAGATTVSGVIGIHDAVVDLIVGRVRQACSPEPALSGSGRH